MSRPDVLVFFISLPRCRHLFLLEFVVSVSDCYIKLSMTRHFEWHNMWGRFLGGSAPCPYWPPPPPPSTTKKPRNFSDLSHRCPESPEKMRIIISSTFSLCEYRNIKAFCPTNFLFKPHPGGPLSKIDKQCCVSAYTCKTGDGNFINLFIGSM